MRITSLRTRLILAFSLVIVIGFAGLAAFAGSQLSSAARQDYYNRLANEVALVARGMEESLSDYHRGQIDEEELVAALTRYEEEACCQLDIITGIVRPDGSPAVPERVRGAPEILSATYNIIVVDRRPAPSGQEMLYTAAPIRTGSRVLGYVHLTTPASSLDQQIRERWTALGAGVVGLGGAAVLVSAWLSISLIKPLRQLRNSAQELSLGHLDHRIEKIRADEVGDVALAFNEMADQLQAMLEEQRAFASNTSHELRTPLTTMRLRTEALRYDDTLDEETRELYIRELDEELVRLAGIVQDLTLLSRFDAGRAETSSGVIDLLAFAESYRRALAPQAAAKGIALSLLHDEGPVLVQTSLNHLTIVVRNLFENALKYTPTGGSVTWHITVEGDEVVSTIQDTGIGVSAEALPHLFERFYREDKAHSRRIPGSGLGLPLVRAIADAYGWQVSIHSEGVGQGTEAVLRLPHTTEDQVSIGVLSHESE